MDSNTSEYFNKLNRHLVVRISLISFIVATFISLVGFWIYPNFLFHYGLQTVFLLLVAITPVLFVWKIINLSRGLSSKILKVVISIWIGLFFAYISSHQIIVKHGELVWKKAANEIDGALDLYYNYHGKYPTHMTALSSSFLKDNNFILNRYIDLIELKMYNKNEWVHSGNISYELWTGFWIADLRVWDSDTHEWKLIY